MDSGEQNYDEEAISRQLGVYGKEAMGKLANMKVLLIGLRGLGAEVAKNLILAGPKKVDIFDSKTSELRDMSANFYLTEDNVNEEQTRASACIEKLAELNPSCEVTEFELEDDQDITEASFKDYDVVVVTEVYESITQIIKINKACRKNNVGFILSQNLGAYGYVFVDFGDEFIVKDKTGEEHKSFNIVGVTNDEKGEVTVHKGKIHSFADGDYVKFREVKGMTELNDHEPIKIQVIDSYTFKLELNTKHFKTYEIDGIVESVNVPTKFKFQSLKDSILHPHKVGDGFFITTDLSLFGRADQLHIAMQAIHQYQQDHEGELPQNHRDEVHEVVEIAHKINEKNKTEGGFFVEKVDDYVVKTAAKFSRAEICPMTSYFGGIVCQEVVKFTGKFTPLQQWYHFDIFNSLPLDKVKTKSQESRYDDQVAVFGREVQEKLQKVKTFMIGAGALGCELLKSFALMGVGCSEDGLISVTDNDHIELSNLNRQFLFRNEHIGKAKSEVACEQAQDINSDLSTKSYQQLVCPETEDTFDDEFWDGNDFIVNAVDNRKARLYVDGKCVWHKKALLDSGTLGTKANTQMVIPHLTESYGDSKDPEEDSIPMCTLRNFPNQIEHCIEWARNKFDELFGEKPTSIRSFLASPGVFIMKLEKDNVASACVKELRLLKELLKIKESDEFLECVRFAKQRFYEDFNLQISNLIRLFPKDHKDSDGNPFWSGPKRFPKVIDFDSEDDLHLDYVFAGANLIAECLGIEKNEDRDAVKELADEVEIDDKVQAEEVNLDEDEEMKSNQPSLPKKKGASDAEAEQQKKELVKEVKEFELEGEDINPAQFEKDDSTNHHIEFINAAANMRARNYRLEECDKFKTKMIAGKIVPAIATTTACIVGAVCVELLKVVQGFNDLPDYRNTFLNLAINMYVQTEPMESKKMVDVEMDPIMFCPVKAVPTGWTIWDTIELKGPLTVKEFMDHMKGTYDVKVQMITTKDKAVYNEFAKKDVMQKRLDMTIHDIYHKELVSSNKLMINDKIIGAVAKADTKNYLILDIGGNVGPSK